MQELFANRHMSEGCLSKLDVMTYFEHFLSLPTLLLWYSNTGGTKGFICWCAHKQAEPCFEMILKVSGALLVCIF